MSTQTRTPVSREQNDGRSDAAQLTRGVRVWFGWGRLLPTGLIALAIVLSSLFVGAFWAVTQEWSSFQYANSRELLEESSGEIDCVARPYDLRCELDDPELLELNLQGTADDAARWEEVGRSFARWASPQGGFAMGLGVALGPVTIFAAVLGAVVVSRLVARGSIAYVGFGARPVWRVLAPGVALTTVASLIVGLAFGCAALVAAVAAKGRYPLPNAHSLPNWLILRRVVVLAVLAFVSAVVGCSVGLRVKRVLDAVLAGLLAGVAVLLADRVLPLNIAGLTALDTRPDHLAHLWPTGVGNLDAEYVSASAVHWVFLAVLLAVGIGGLLAQRRNMAIG